MSNIKLTDPLETVAEINNFRTKLDIFLAGLKIQRSINKTLQSEDKDTDNHIILVETTLITLAELANNKTS